MPPDEDNWRSRRGDFLTFLFIVTAIVGPLVFLFMVCGGFSIYVAAVPGGILLLGCLHYLLWGRLFSRSVAGEREEDEVRTDLERSAESPDGNGTGLF
jgi:hypothetical protein